jgi:two-component system, sensor histidine kinase and response regulator
MNNNQTFVSENPGSELNKIRRVNGYSKVKSTPEIATFNENNIYVDPLFLQLSDMHKANAALVDLLEQRTNELAEFVAITTHSFSVIGHDLRSPVCTVLAALELLKLKLGCDYPVGSDKFIDIASDSAKRTLDMLDKLLEWSISKKNCTTFNPVKINLHEFLMDELEKEKSPLELKSITMDYSVDPGLNVLGDIHMVRTILRNLISNAIKFTGYGGKIKVMGRAAGRFVVITVTDNGAGMSLELQKDILKNEDGKFKIPGNDGKINGIGLLLCKEFIESHGGELQIVSKPGRGSKFRFSLERID